jgi:transposase-like protein
MNPTLACCPHLACPARGQAGKGTMGMHARKEKRFICRHCGKTFTDTTGTACDRRRTPVETVALVITLLAHGCPLPAIVVACGFEARTVADWVVRAGRQGQAVQQQLVEQPRDLGPVQADDIRVKKQGGVVGMALAMMVSPRWWLAGEVREPRDLSLLRRLSKRVRACALSRTSLCCTDGWWADVRAIRETVRDAVRPGTRGPPRLRPGTSLLIAQGVQRDAKRRVVAVERRLRQGATAQGEQSRDRSPGDGVLNTASIERLHATCRARLSALTRRGRALARQTCTRQHGMDWIGAIDHFCTPHERWRWAKTAAGGACAERRPAMAAGITDHGWSIRERLSLHVPPPRWTPAKRRGRPSRALQRLVERWCL